MIASMVLLSIGSFMHREPEKPPFIYLVWFLRLFMLWYTLNLVVDAWHISGTECDAY